MTQLDLFDSRDHASCTGAIVGNPQPRTCNRCASWNDGSPYGAGLLGWCNHRRREACYGDETCDRWVPNTMLTVSGGREKTT